MGYGILDFRYGILDVGYGILDVGYGILDVGYGIFDVGYGILDVGYWKKDLIQNPESRILPCPCLKNVDRFQPLKLVKNGDNRKI